MLTIHDPAVRAHVRKCAEQLRPDARAQWGNFSCAEMLFHVNAGMEIALGELYAEPVGNPAFWHTTGKAIALGEEPWPEGAPTSTEALASEPVHFGAERERLSVLLERIANTSEHATWPDSPRFGPMTGEDWSRLMYNHVRHHFRQFGVWAETE